MDLTLWLKRHKANKTGKAPVSIRITIGGQRAEISTKIRLHPLHWDAATGRVANHPTLPEKERLSSTAIRLLNDNLDIQVAKVKLLKTTLDHDGLTVRDIVAALRPTPTIKPVVVDLLAVLEYQLTSHYQGANPATLGNFAYVVRALREWHGQPVLEKAAFHAAARQRFALWLCQGRASSTVRTYLSALTAMWKRAGLFTDVGPFAGVKLPRHTPTPRASLSRGQLQQLATGALSGSLALARDVYMACFYLHGSRLGAVLLLRWQDFDGERIRYQAAKGGPLKSVKVTPALASLLERYGPAGAQELIFPVLRCDYYALDKAARFRDQKRAISNINEWLWHACKQLGLPENIHPHTARHTMARMTAETTKDIRAAQHVLGHTTYRQTEAYIRSMLTEETDAAASSVYDSL